MVPLNLFRLQWLLCCIYLGLPYQLIVSFFSMCLPVLGLVYVQCRPLSLDIPNTRRLSFSIIFPRSLVVVYRFVFSGSSPFSPAILLLTFSEYYWIVWHTLTLLLFCKMWCTVSLCSPHNLYMPHSAVPVIFFQVLVSIICSYNANIDGVFVGYISINQSLLRNIILVFHSEAPFLLNFVVYSFCAL